MRVTDLPPLMLTRDAFEVLDEYSYSVPTWDGQTKRIWRCWTGSFWVVGRHEDIPGDPLRLRICWYTPAIIPPEAQLEERGGLWVGQLGSLKMAAFSWQWVWRELWRIAKADYPREVHLPPIRRAA